MLLVVLGALIPRAMQLINSSPRLSVLNRTLLAVIVLTFVASATLSAIQIDNAIKAGNTSARRKQIKTLTAEAEAMSRRLDDRSRRIRQTHDEATKIDLAPKPDDPTLVEVERIRAANLREEGLGEVLASQHETKRWIAVEHRIRELLEKP